MVQNNFKKKKKNKSTSNNALCLDYSKAGFDRFHQFGDSRHAMFIPNISRQVVFHLSEPNRIDVREIVRLCTTNRIAAIYQIANLRSAITHIEESKLNATTQYKTNTKRARKRNYDLSKRHSKLLKVFFGERVVVVQQDRFHSDAHQMLVQRRRERFAFVRGDDSFVRFEQLDRFGVHVLLEQRVAQSRGRETT